MNKNKQNQIRKTYDTLKYELDNTDAQDLIDFGEWLLAAQVIQDVVEEWLYEINGYRTLDHFLQLPNTQEATDLADILKYLPKLWSNKNFFNAICSIVKEVSAGCLDDDDGEDMIEDAREVIIGQIQHYCEAFHLSENICLFIPRIALPHYYLEKKVVELSVAVTEVPIESTPEISDAVDPLSEPTSEPLFVRPTEEEVTESDTEDDEPPKIVVEMKQLEENARKPAPSRRRRRKRAVKVPKPRVRINHMPYWFTENQRIVAENLAKATLFMKEVYGKYRDEVISGSKIDTLYLDVNDAGLEKDEVIQMFRKRQTGERGLMIHSTFKRGINNDSPSEIYDYNSGRDHLIKPECNGTTRNDISTLFHVFSELVVKTGYYSNAYSQLIRYINNNEVDITAIYFVLHNLSHMKYAEHDHCLYRQIYRKACEEVELKEITRIIDMRNTFATKFRGSTYPYAQVRREKLIDQILLLDSHETNINNEIRAVLAMRRLPKCVNLTHVIARKEVLALKVTLTGKGKKNKEPKATTSSQCSSTSYQSTAEMEDIPLDQPQPTAILEPDQDQGWFGSITTLPERVFNRIIASVKSMGSVIGAGLIEGVLTAVKSFLLEIKQKIIQVLHMSWAFIRPAVDMLIAMLRKIGVYSVNLVFDHEAQLMLAIFLLCGYLSTNKFVKAVLFMMALQQTNILNIVKDYVYEFFDDDDDAIELTGTGDILTWLASDPTKVCTGVICALLVTVCGVAAKTISRGDISSIVTNCFRNLHFTGAGIAALPKIVQNISTMVKEVVNYAKKKFGFKVSEPQKDNAKRAITFAVYVNAISDELSLKTIRTDKKMQDEILAMRKEWIWLQVYLTTPEFKNLETNVAIQVRAAIQNYKTLANYVSRLAMQAGFRYTTFHIQLCGSAGVGKSTLTSRIVEDLAKQYYPDMNRADLTWSRTDKDHFDGYANQKIVIYDDMWTINDAKSYVESIHLITNTPTPLPMAHLDSKHIYFDSEFMISTVNDPYPDIKDVLCKSAVERRRHILAKVKCDPKCMGPDGKFCIKLASKEYNITRDGKPATDNAEFVKEKVQELPWLKFDILNPIKAASNNNNIYFEVGQEPNGLSQPLENLSYLEFYKRIVSRQKRMKEEESMSLNIDAKLQQNLNEGYVAIKTLVSQSRESMPILDVVDLGTFAMPTYSQQTVPEVTTSIAQEVSAVIGVIAAETSGSDDDDEEIALGIERDLGGAPLPAPGAPPQYTPGPIQQLFNERRNAQRNEVTPEHAQLQAQLQALANRTAELFKGEYVRNEMLIPERYTLRRELDLFHLNKPVLVPDAPIAVSPQVIQGAGITENIEGLSAFFMFCFSEDGHTFLARDYLRGRFGAFDGTSAMELLKYRHVREQFQLIMPLSIYQRAVLARTARLQYEAIYDRAALRVRVLNYARNTGLQLLDLVTKGFRYMLNNLAKTALSFLIGLYLACIVVILCLSVLELFKDPEPTSRVYFKQPVSKVHTTSAVVTQASAQRITESAHIVDRNLLRLELPLLGTRSGLGIEGQCLITAAHNMEPLLEQETFEMNLYLGAHPEKPIKVQVKSKDCYHLEDSDLLLIYSIQIPMFTSIRNRFYTEKMLENITPSEVWLKYMNERTRVMERYPVKNLMDAFRYAGANRTYEQRTLVYYGDPAFGSSGGVLMAPTNHSNNCIIIGIQCAKKNGKAFSCILTQEMLTSLISNLGDKHIMMLPPPVEEVEVTSTTRNLFVDNVRFFSQISEKKVLGIMGKTQYRKTIFAQEIKSERKPAVLDAFDKRVKPGTHPMQHSINKYGRDEMKPLPSHLVKRAVKNIADHLGALLPRPPRFMTIEEVVQGNPDHTGMNLKTSPGIPWVYQHKTKPGKQSWLSKDLLGEVTVTPEIRRAIEAAHKSLRSGIIPPTLMYEFPKDELRPIEKVLKARSISVNDMTMSVLANTYLLDLTNMLHDIAKEGKTPFTIGVDPNSLTWLEMYHRMNKFGSRCSDADIGNWDGHMTPQLCMAAMKIFIILMRRCPDFTKEDEKVLKGFALQMIFAYVQILDLVIHTMRGMKSGWFKTAELNTLAHWILFLVFYYQLVKDYPGFDLYVSFLRYVTLYLYGDDIMFSLSEDLPLTPMDFYSLYEEYGWPVSAADKISSFEHFKELPDIQFLKRRFVPDERLGKSWIHARIERSVIDDLVVWLRTQSNENEQLYVNINEALCFIFPYGKFEYEAFLQTINCVLHRNQRALVIMPYSDMRRILYNRYLET